MIKTHFQEFYISTEGGGELYRAHDGDGPGKILARDRWTGDGSLLPRADDDDNPGEGKAYCR